MKEIIVWSSGEE